MSKNDHTLIEESSPPFRSRQQSNDEIEHPKSTTHNGNVLSLKLVECLQVASCLSKHEGTKVDKDMLACALGNVKNVGKILEEAISKKLLATITENDEPKEANGEVSVATKEKTYYRFHDREKQEKTYNSIPEPETMHVEIGDRLLKSSKQEEPPRFDAATVVQQFLLGESGFLKHHVKNTATRVSPDRESLLTRVVGLCLGVGRNTIRISSDFETAALYFNFGIRILHTMKHYFWRREYQLSLELHCAAAEANYATSNFEYAQTIIDELISNARTFQDTWGIHAIQIYVLGARGKREEAITVGLKVLQQLNEAVVEYPKRWHIVWGFVTTKRILRNKTPESILRLPTMVNAEKLAAMQMLNLIMCHAVSVRPYLAPVLVFRLVELTLTHGLSVMSSAAFAHYGMILSKFGPMDEAYRYSKLALALYNKYTVPEWLPRVYLGVYAGVYSSVKDLKRTIEPLTYASRVGLTTGDNEVAFIDAHVCTLNRFTVGEPLELIEKDAKMYYEETIARKLTWLSRRFALMLQFFRNFMEEYADPTSMIGSAFNDGMYKEVCTNDLMFSLIFRLCKLILCFTFGDYKVAVQSASWCRDSRRQTPSHHAIFMYVYLFDGLAAVAHFRQETARNGKRRIPLHKLHLIQRVKHHIRYLKRQALINPSLCSCKLYLLQAELAAWLLEKHDKAIFYYTSAISVAASSGVHMDLGLVHECLARYKLFHGDDEEELSSKHHFQQALDAYRTWGAHAKAKHLEVEVAKLCPARPRH